MCGFSCSYSAESRSDSSTLSLRKKGLCVPVCPEVLGGLPVPRLPSEIVGGTGADVLAGTARVVNSAGEDVTAQFIDGARRALLIGLQTGCSAAILKARSPSCGSGCIYDGTFSHTRVAGDGVLAVLLKRYGFAVATEEEILSATHSS